MQPVGNRLVVPNGPTTGRFGGKVRAGQVLPLLESLAELALVRGQAGTHVYSA